MDWKQHKKRLAGDPDFREEYGALGLEHRLAAELVRLRLAKGLTQEQLANILHTKQEGIARLESGRSLPSLSTIKRLAAAMDAEFEIKLLPKSRTRTVGAISRLDSDADRSKPPVPAGYPEVATSHDDGMPDLFRKSAIFSDLDEKHLIELSRLAVRQNLKAGQFLFGEGEPAECCYLVVSGIFKVVRHSTSGIDFITAIYGQGEMLGNVNLFVVKPRRSSAQAIVDSEVLSISNVCLVDPNQNGHPLAPYLA